MLLAGHHTESRMPTIEDSAGMRIRVRGGNSAEQLVNLPFGKTTIGSSPRCDVRIQQSDVRPVHLLIVREQDGLSVRSWASDSVLNGEHFQEAPLKPGDCLKFASVELQIECGTNAAIESRETDAPIVERSESKFETIEPKAGSQPPLEFTPPAKPDCDVQRMPTGSGNADDLCIESVTASDPSDPTAEVQTKPGKANGTIHRKRGRRRHSRGEYRLLAERVEGLECLMEAALFEPQNLSEQVDRNERSAPAGIPESSPITDACGQSAFENTALECEIENLKGLLAAAERAIAEWQKRHEILEQERAQWEADRAGWETHRAELQTRLADSETRMAEYFGRIERLEQELAVRREMPADTIRPVTETEFHDDQLGSGLERVSASEPWPVAEQRELGDTSGDEWKNTPVQASFSVTNSPATSDDNASSFSDFRTPTTAEPAPAEFDWSTAGKLRSSEWGSGNHSDEPGALARPVPESAASQGSNWSQWQSQSEWSRNSSDAPVDSPVVSENAWSVPSGSEGIPAARQSDRDSSEFTKSTPASQASGEFTWPAAPSATPPAPAESDDDFAPFAEFSIWNQGAQLQEVNAGRYDESSDGETGQAASGVFGTPSDAPPTPSSEPAQPNTAEPAKESRTSSFIERYAHMFTDDDSMDESSRLASPPSQAEDDTLVRKPRAMGGSGLSGQSPESSEDEESIEQYMAKLMQRVRGEGPHVAASQAPFSTAPQVADAPLATGQASTPIRSESETPAAGSTPSANINKEEFLTTSLGTVRRKSVTVERPGNLEAFRALANESARRAISTHALHKHRRTAVTKAIVATLAGMTSVFVMLEAPGWLDLQFITAGVALLAAAYWAGQTYGTMVESFRAASYDGPDELLENLIDPFRPALPIDVER
jgi:hypothetical protein